ncbi:MULTISPECIES: JAB domain-containing protein [Oscillospiraceae]|uniref:DNA repair protein RadC n=1 Tax=Lawsonibacter faecis TaxID=2763052 RepID=A0A8J6M7Z6_9FIRM|nr:MULTISPECIES: DNA repair protein RadC [Oscillospiraceae]MTQ95325.1 DNA repair protein RadC [Pseudoflavonifractor sp. BIOML-A16]MTR07100.1 DNA repair protein RadC [Pseudoflavonifractor sp. BIOML-A15]MTR32337.1 DNA repair protein RadC [Pseudoflavonifractor sp. BIOML-A14]MTR72689.1 DNA repair protein RadC [Pseudoflavonifractor sp. BIOML-A18]MTS64182.1 DNA repair protein RadC [Pseudoflavonifractor sp. BIOML-A5]MTS70083.1 DNA repair protein RadC [Pseudoflavonifractor sp. BIOML-A8]MTS91646.1 DN
MADHSGHRDRLRGEFLARSESFPDHKVLELLLFYALPRQDTNPIAHDLLERFGSLEGVLDAPPEALAQVKGVGDRSAVLFKAVKELARRYAAGRSRIGNLITTNYAAYEILHPLFFGARNERVYLLCLDGKKKLLGCAKLGEGNVNAAEVTPRGVVETALNHNAARVILAHNHVSGLALPSDEDKATTLYLQTLLSQVGVLLDDHLIFVDDDMVSLKDSGLLPEVK